MAWAENNYIETRFVGGMNCSVEPHTLDRDTGELPDIMNMVCRTQALRTRKGFVPISDLAAEYSSMPINAPSALFNFEYEPDLPEETTEETEEETVTGGSVLPYVDGGGSSSGGHGGGGNVLPKPEPEPAPEPVAMWSVSGPGSIYPYVPFELTITRNSGTGKPTWLMGVLAPSSAGGYKGTDKWLTEVSANVWKREVMNTNLNRSIEDIIYKAGSSSASYGQCSVDYALYGFYPELPDAVTVGEAFEFTVECRDMDVIEGYKGNGRGCALTWTFLNANGQPTSGSVSVTGATWANGVMTASGVANTVDGVMLRLTATFLGEEHSDVAAINAGEVGIDVDEAPIALHIYGKGSTLQISATGEFSPSHLGVACTVNGSAVGINDVLELATAEGGSRDISFASGWSDENVWSKDVRAKSNTAYAGSTLRIVFTYMNGEDRCTATADIDIEETIIGSLVASPSSIYSGDTVALTATISGNVDVGLDISRVPFRLMFLAHADDDGFTVTPDKDITDGGNWSESGANLLCAFNAVVEGTPAKLPAMLRYVFGMDNEWIAYADIAVALPNYAAMLAEAINERILAKTGTAGTYTENDGASTLRSGAIDCAKGFMDGELSSDNTYTNYSNSHQLDIDAAAETVQWYQSAYNKVKSVVKMVASATVSNYLQVSRSLTKRQDYNDETEQWEPSPSVLQAQTINELNNKAWTENDSPGQDVIAAFRYLELYEGYGGQWTCSSNMNCESCVVTLAASYFHVSATVDIYAQRVSQSYVDFNSFGHHVPSSSFGVALSEHCNAGNSFASSRIAALGKDITAPTSPIGGEGYYIEIKRAVLEYDFTHKG